MTWAWVFASLPSAATALEKAVTEVFLEWGLGWLRLHAAHLAMLPCLSVCLSLPPEAGKVPEFSSQAGAPPRQEVDTPARAVCVVDEVSLDRVGRRVGTGEGD